MSLDRFSQGTEWDTEGAAVHCDGVVWAGTKFEMGGRFWKWRGLFLEGWMDGWIVWHVSWQVKCSVLFV